MRMTAHPSGLYFNEKDTVLSMCLGAGARRGAGPSSSLVFPQLLHLRNCGTIQVSWVPGRECLLRIILNHKQPDSTRPPSQLIIPIQFHSPLLCLALLTHALTPLLVTLLSPPCLMSNFQRRVCQKEGQGLLVLSFAPSRSRHASTFAPCSHSPVEALAFSFAPALILAALHPPHAYARYTQRMHCQSLPPRSISSHEGARFPRSSADTALSALHIPPSDPQTFSSRQNWQRFLSRLAIVTATCSLEDSEDAPPPKRWEA